MRTRDLTDRAGDNELVSRHPGAVIVRNFVGWVRISHRAVPQPGGMVCDAPETVGLGFGSSSRKLFLADALATNACVRRELVEHEAAHSAAFNNSIDRFISENEGGFKEGMVALKNTAAASFEAASAMWEAGLQLIISKVRGPLLADLAKANADVDSPQAMKELETACNGALRKLEALGLY